MSCPWAATNRLPAGAPGPSKRTTSRYQKYTPVSFKIWVGTMGLLQV
jgi:hypothetical protein